MTATVATILGAAVFVTCMGLAAWSDLRTMRLPNALALALMAGFALWAPLSGLSLGAIGDCVAVGLIALGAGFMLFTFGVIGGGDAKFAAATALWMGPGLVTDFLVLTAMLGGALALAVLAARRLAAARRAPAGLPWLIPGAGVPYGAALAGAGMWVFLADRLPAAG